VVGTYVDIRVVKRLSSHYKDAYRHASLLIFLGNFVKVLGILVGCFIFLVGQEASRNPFSFQAAPIGGTILAIILGGIILLWGVLISSAGQMMRATIDSAVNNSPLLSNLDRIAIMGLE
jgi:hypothetical protein